MLAQRTMLRCAFIYGLLSIVYSLNAQLNFDFLEGKFLIKGQVTDVQTGRPVGFANIIINSSGKGITCDNEGNFSMYVYRKDTLHISSVGYLAKQIYVVNIDSADIYTVAVKLAPDAIKIKDVVIYPWGDRDKFPEAFMAAKDMNKVTIPGVAPPKYSNVAPKPKFTNPVSFLYDKFKKKRSANPDFKP